MPKKRWGYDLGNKETQVYENKNIKTSDPNHSSG